MAMGKPKKLKNLVGALKDQTAIIRASFSVASSIKLAVLRATTHNASDPPSDADTAAFLALIQHDFPPTLIAFIGALMDRLHTTSNPAVAIKSLFALHFVVTRGSFNLRHQLAFFPDYGGRNFLNLSAFRNAEMKDFSSWARWYAGVVEQNMIVWRNLDYLSCFRSRNRGIQEEGKNSSRLNTELAGELDVLVDFAERICEFPESLHLQRNNLVYEVVRLVIENYRFVQREILIRVKELGGRQESLRLDELTQLIRTLTRYEDCRRRLSELFVNRGRNEDLWDLIKQTKKELEDQKRMKEEKRMIMVKIRADSVESTRLWNPFVEPGQVLWIPAGDGSWGPPPLSRSVSTVG